MASETAQNNLAGETRHSGVAQPDPYLRATSQKEKYYLEQ